MSAILCIYSNVCHQISYVQSPKILLTSHPLPLITPPNPTQSLTPPKNNQHPHILLHNDHISLPPIPPLLPLPSPLNNPNHPQKHPPNIPNKYKHPNRCIFSLIWNIDKLENCTDST